MRRADAQHLSDTRQRFHAQGFCAAALLLRATLLSFLTVSSVLWAISSLLGWTP
jgi:hypothetical protein